MLLFLNLDETSFTSIAIRCFTSLCVSMKMRRFENGKTQLLSGAWA